MSRVKDCARERQRPGRRAQARLLLALLLAGLAWGPRAVGAAWQSGAAGPHVPAAQDDYPLPPTPPPGLPTYDPYALPPEPGAPTAEPSATPTATLTPRPTDTVATPARATATSPLLPTITPTRATPSVTTAATPDPSPTIRVRTITPLPDEQQPDEDATLAPTEAAIAPPPPTWTPRPTADRAAALIARAVTREEATLAAPQSIAQEEPGRGYGGFVALAALLLAGISYAALLRRQRQRDRQAYLQALPDEE
jgi:hypothetical protein